VFRNQRLAVAATILRAQDVFCQRARLQPVAHSAPGIATVRHARILALVDFYSQFDRLHPFIVGVEQSRISVVLELRRALDGSETDRLGTSRGVRSLVEQRIPDRSHRQAVGLMHQTQQMQQRQSAGGGGSRGGRR